MNRFFQFFILFAFVISGISGYASQNITEPSDKYKKVIINLEDGTQKSGYVKEFRKTQVYITGASFEKPIFDKFGLRTKKFVFRKNEESKKERISISDVKSIEFILNTDEYGVMDRLIYEKVILGKLNNRKKIKSENVYTLLPVCFKNPKITVYSLTIDGFPIFYFRGRDTELALYQGTRFGDMFKPQNFVDRLYSMFEVIGEGCPEYIEWLQSNKPEASAKWVFGDGRYNDEEVDFSKSYKLDIKEAKKSMTEEEYESYLEWRNKQERRKIFDRAYGMYDELVIQYINTCD